ncbi:hypothetical protein CAEBREN_24245 [Caenorhabditis brenneri]|uniref:Homeobox domain-containing protein n=1 Tax=Caenorhabditis brenneri TaxID=135651 RepID=G0MMT5_CAEBE|nr:hypothetical protein CAEBREN_24245 [Caenorhabditis brenneri]
MSENTITGQELKTNHLGLIDLNTLLGINLGSFNASGSLPKKPDLWKHIGDPTKVLWAYYSERNFYHNENIKELATLANVVPNTVRETLARFRKRDEIAGKYVPPPPKPPKEFTEEQRQVLLDAFKESEYIDPEGAQEISRITDLTTKQVNNWFCNQRQRVDGKGDFEREKRSLINKERRAKGLMRASPFSSEVLKYFEEEYKKIELLTKVQGKPAKVSYDKLVEKTGVGRKKIRDWFSKRKIRGRSQSVIKENLEETEALLSFMGQLSGNFTSSFTVPSIFPRS